ncbi:MAG: SMP-30/gluconolactonase/LRE family protein [Candidatus Sericytochromatia bacterium]|nr:SMP-30/gluconolactonase/LRE family protein [Candidatus Sericytochromatia bacterium]
MRQGLCFQTLLACVALSFSAAQAQTAVKELAPLPDGPAGAVWYERQVLVPQAQADSLSIWDQRQLNRLMDLNQCQPSALLPLQGNLLLACAQSPRLLVINPMGQVLESWPRPREESGLVRGGDNKAPDLSGATAMVKDSRGGVYIAVTGAAQADSSAARQGKIYYLSASRTLLTSVASLLDYPSGLAISPDGKQLYVSEGLSRQVKRFDINQTRLENPAVFMRLADIHTPAANAAEAPRPGALAFNTRGHLYVALQGEGQILVTSAEGRKLAALPVPLPYVKGFSFSRSDRVLYIAAARSAEPGAAGALYEMRL